MMENQYTYTLNPVVRYLSRLFDTPKFLLIMNLFVSFSLSGWLITVVDFPFWLSRLKIIWWFTGVCAIYPSVLLLIFLMRWFFNSVKYHFFGFLLQVQFLHGIVRGYLLSQSNLKIKCVIFYKQFHLLTHFAWKDMKIAIRLMDKNLTVKEELSPHGIKLIQDCIQSNFMPRTMNAFIEYYSPSLDALIQAILDGKKLPEYQLQRVYYELTSNQQEYLEQHLSKNHAVIQKINEIHQISVHGEYKILK